MAKNQGAGAGWFNSTASHQNEDNAHAVFDGQFGDPEIENGRAEALRFAEILGEARALVAEEGFLHWQVVFPGVRLNRDSAGLSGDPDADIRL